MTISLTPYNHTMNRLQTRIGAICATSLTASLFTASLFTATGALFAAPLASTSSQGIAGGATAVQEEAPAAAKETKAAPQVMGTVLFDGEIPEAKPLSIPARAAEGCCPTGETVDDDNMALIISKEGGIQNVVVTVKVAGVEVEIPKEPYLLDQKGCRFIPHMLVVPKGATVSFLNSDETSHNVHLIAMANEALNQTVTAGKHVERTFTEAEPVKVTCDMHTWMNSWVYVADATHFTLTDADGKFSLDGLPPGEHEVTFWHETLKSKTAKVVVGEDGKVAAPMEVKFAPKQTKKRRRRR
ncbi:MAG: plastocyanin [Paracoccaceae bacterium]